MKREKDMSIPEQINLHGNSMESIMSAFTRKILQLDYTSEGVGTALAVCYDIIT